MRNVKKIFISLVLVLSLVCGSASVYAGTNSPAQQGASKITLGYTSVVYTGYNKTPRVTCYDSNGKVIPSQYVAVAYANNKGAGKATVKIILIGKYKGEYTKNFTIKKATPKVTTSKTAKASTVKKKTVSLGDLVTGAGHGKVTKVSGSSRLTVTTGGTVKVKKGTKKGTYKIKVKVAGTANCNGVSYKTITVRVK